MQKPANTIRHSSIEEELAAEIALQTKTIEELNAGGHITTDAERHLRDLQQTLAGMVNGTRH